ncbi:protein PAT1 homolog 1 [Cylas formicarius]|uniref:protein PAT1 homolog 1 n=1 Tax=Cylas formicarius TaxID=197179 RepID=UPI0029587384|nr:protein PAT1 homolog 1 [Cylas formicarius]
MFSRNPMANTFFDFDSSLNGNLELKNGETLLPEEDDCIENEEEYDALNDETFGALDESSLDDWEQQHEQFAEINESSKQSEQIENSLSQLVLDDSSDDSEAGHVSFTKDPLFEAFTPTLGREVLQQEVLTSIEKASRYFIKSRTDAPNFNNQSARHPPGLPNKICTVEELEKNLIQNSRNNVHVQQKPLLLPPQQSQPGQRPVLPPPPGVHHFHPILQHPNARLPPPGLPPLNMPPPRPPLNAHHHPMMPPGMIRMMPPHPHLMQHNGPPGFMYINHHGNNLPANHPFNFPPPPHSMGMMANKNMHQKMYSNQTSYGSPTHHHPRSRNNSGNYRYERRDLEEVNRDEYAGLMTIRDKQWLLNIQLLQLNTGTPYFDDYYYTIFKERKLKNNKENTPNNDKGNWFGASNGRQRRNSERQENNTLTPRVYTPLQFENSLGKLQCGSVTAPRKIIDMDIVTPDKDLDSLSLSKDSRKTKQLLLELEALYSLLLKAEDIKNPLFISNMEKLREIKQKQRLKELEQAPTSEQKQEVLRLFKMESEPIVENQLDYFIKIVSALLQDDKFASFMNIRKGKMLLLRVLPHLTRDQFASQLLEIWSRLLLSLPVIGRRDTAGDNILPKFYPSFKRYVQNCDLSEILHMTSGLVEVVRQENSRSTPLSHVGKAPLYFMLLNKFGVSALTVMLVRSELLFSSSHTEKQTDEWATFLCSWAKHTEIATKVAVPIEPVAPQTFVKHVNRFPSLSAENKASLERYFVETRSLT